jgi:hypothetical protein
VKFLVCTPFSWGNAGVVVHNGDTDDRALPVYQDPKDVPKAGTTDIDHRDSQKVFPERKNNPTNKVPEDSYVNRGPRAAITAWRLRGPAQLGFEFIKMPALREDPTGHFGWTLRSFAKLATHVAQAACQPDAQSPPTGEIYAAGLGACAARLGTCAARFGAARMERGGDG